MFGTSTIPASNKKKRVRKRKPTGRPRGGPRKKRPVKFSITFQVGLRGKQVIARLARKERRSKAWICREAVYLYAADKLGEPKESPEIDHEYEA